MLTLAVPYANLIGVRINKERKKTGELCKLKRLVKSARAPKFCAMIVVRSA